MLANCFRFAPRDSVPGLIAKICKYLKDHPGWSEEELEDQIKKFISATGVESFNGRTGTVTLDKNDVNNLKIASAYFSEGDESIDSLDLVSLYNQGVRFVFTDFNSVTSGYNLAFVLDYLSGSGDVVYYPMSTGSGGGGNIVSVNGKTGVVELSLADIVGTSGVQVKLCTAEEFTSTTTTTWNAYYKEGYRIVGVVNSSATAIDYIYLLKQNENNHTPIVISTGASDAYTPANPPPYPVESVNGKTGVVTGLYSEENPPPYPVTKVNNKTGVVQLNAGDVGAVPSTGGKFSGEVTAPRFNAGGDKLPIYGALRFRYGNKDVFSLSVDILEDRERYRFMEFARDGSGKFESYDFPTIDKNLTANKYYSIFTSKNPPPYPVTSVNGKTGAVNISEIKVARVNTEVTDSNFEHRFLKSSLPNLNTNLSIEEAILSVVGWGSNPIIPFRIGGYGDYVTVHLSLINGDLVTIPSTLTILYR